MSDKGLSVLSNSVLSRPGIRAVSNRATFVPKLIAKGEAKLTNTLVVLGASPVLRAGA